MWPSSISHRPIVEELERPTTRPLVRFRRRRVPRPAGRSTLFRVFRRSRQALLGKFAIGLRVGNPSGLAFFRQYNGLQFHWHVAHFRIFRLPAQCNR